MFPLLRKSSTRGNALANAFAATPGEKNSWPPTTHKQNSFCSSPALKYGTRMSSRSHLVSKKTQKCDPQGTRPTAGRPESVSTLLLFSLGKDVTLFIADS